jgi:hypothetical protein
VKQILVVEDESRIVRIVRNYLERARYRVAVEMQWAGCACVAGALRIGLPQHPGELPSTFVNRCGILGRLCK